MLGIYIDNLKLPWVPDIFRLAEKMDVVIFTNNFTEFDVFNKVSVLASHHIWSFKDPIIAGDTFSARYLSGCPIQQAYSILIILTGRQMRLMRST